MKKIISVLIIVLIALSLGACGNKNSVKVNSISKTQLTDDEKTLLASTSDKSFVFDFNVDSTYKEASVWVEKYEFGKKAEDVTGLIQSSISEKGKIIFSTIRTTKDASELFSICIASGNSLSKANSLNVIMKNNRANVAGTWGSNETKNIPISDNMTLASMSYSRGGSLRSLSKEFYEDTSNHLDEIKDYDEVYLLKCKFIK